MKTFSTGFAAEIAKKRGAKPVWLLSMTVGGVSYYISDVVVTIPTWMGGVTTKAWVSQWGQISEQLTGGLNEIRIADFSLSLVADPDDADNITHLALLHNLEASPCSLYLWFRDLTAADDPPHEFFRGYVRDVALPDEFTVQLTIEDESSKLTAPFGVVLSQENYPACLANHVGRMLPVIFGTATGVNPPVAKVDTTYNYYAFGGPVDSVASIKRKNTDGTYTTLTATTGTPTGDQYRLYTGRTGDEATGFAGKGVIVAPKQTGSAITSTQQTTASPTGITLGGVWYGSGSNYAVDGNDNTYYNTTAYSAYHPTFAFSPGVTTCARVRGRARLSTNVATTLSVKNASGTVIATVTSAAGLAGAWIDTGWITYTGSLATATMEVTFGSYNQPLYVFGGYLDVEYSYQSGTTYIDNPVEMVCTARSFPTVTNVTLRPTTAPDSTINWSVTNEPLQRDSDPVTYCSVTNSGLDCRESWVIYVPVDDSVTRFRFGAVLTYTLAGGNMQLWVSGYESGGTSVGGRIIQLPTNGSQGTVTSDWTYPWGVVSYFDLTLTFPAGSSNIRVHDIWLEYDYGASSQIDVIASDILGQTVTITQTPPASYLVNGAMVDQRRVIDWLDYLAFQFRCFFRMSCGVSRLIWRQDTSTPVATISAVRVESGRKVWSRRKAPKSDIINAITLRYGRDYSLSGDEAYSAISSATDSASVADFGKLSRDELFKLDFCQQIDHAQSLRDFYLSKFKYRYWIEELEVFLDSIALEFGDIVTLPDGRVGVVMSVGIQPGSIDQMDRIKLTVMV